MIGAISIIIPAAGRSERMGAANKLLLPLEGRPVLGHVVESAVQAGPLEVIVVTGHDRQNIEQNVAHFVDSCDALVIHNPDFEEGMGSTIRAGIGAASPEAFGYAILLADLPFVLAGTIRQLAEHLTPDRIVVPTYEGERGHPVLFGRAYRDELLDLQGDAGARSVIEAHAGVVLLITTDDSGIVRDIDNRQDYEGACAG